MINSIITATGVDIPLRIIKNDHFKDYEFFTFKGGKYVLDPTPSLEVADIYTEKTGIEQRRYVEKGLVTSDTATSALKDTGPNLEDLDFIIVAHNFGDYNFSAKQGESVPSIAARVKKKAGIKNPETKAFDIIGGCPGWLMALDTADSYIRSGKAKKIAVIGAETLSYFSDSFNKDTTIFADGAGAVILSAIESEEKEGILSYAGRTDANLSDLLTMQSSVNPNHDQNLLYMRMIGPEVYKTAVTIVPGIIEKSLEVAGFGVQDVNMFLAHQANAKLDIGILKKLLNKGDFRSVFHKELLTDVIQRLMPLTVRSLANSSAATIPMLLHLVLTGEIDNYARNYENKSFPEKVFNTFKALMHSYSLKDNKSNVYRIKRGDVLCFFSVGAGMNSNALVYKVPKCQYKHFPSFEEMLKMN